MSSFPNISVPYQEITEKLQNIKNLDVSAKYPWIRLTSAVNGGLILQSIYNEDGFQTRYGGLTDEQSSGIIGVNLKNEPVRLNNGRKLRPSPTVSQVSIDEADIGRKKTSFTITCYSKEQAEKVAEHFLEPGFTVLVEWGWNTQLSRKQWVGNETQNNNEVTVDSILSYDNYTTIKNKRKSSNFDYDATLGFITDGRIAFGEGETYNLEITLTSLGEVAEYMQQHFETKEAKDKTQPGGGTNPIKEDVSDSNLPLGELLYRYMYTELPSYKQKRLEKYLNLPLQKPYSLGNKIEDDNRYNDDTNYINFNSALIDKINSKGVFVVSASATEYGGGGRQVKVSSDEQPLLSEERFVRFEVAIDILNNNNLELDKNSKSPLVINIDDTICGAFKNIFSTDKSKLFIPNTQAPNFKLNESLALESDDASTNIIVDMDDDGNISNTTNLHPTPKSNIEYKGTRLKNGQKTPHAFPSTYELTEEDNPINKIDDTFIPFSAKKYNWGWLKNLYINYDFFLETIQKDNYFIKDVLYELLNGMSLAANSHWKFQIIESPILDGDFKGGTELKVVDLNFTGIVNLPTKNSNGKEVLDIPVFQTRGTKSPFLSVDFSTDLPKAMQNSIIQKRLTNSSNLETHQVGGSNYDSLGLVFSDKIDPVLQKRNQLNKKTENIIIGPQQETGTTSDVASKDDSELTPQKTRRKNVDFFRDRGGIFLKNQTPIPHKIEGFALDYLMVGTWNDKELIKQLYKNNINSDHTEAEKARLNIPYGMAELNFRVFGMSGFKRGDMLRFSGLLKKFEKNCVYEVYSIKHEITTSGWFTNITCKLRPYLIESEDNYDENIPELLRAPIT